MGETTFHSRRGPYTIDVFVDVFVDVVVAVGKATKPERAKTSLIAAEQSCAVDFDATWARCGVVE
jgi:hypothetical protein